MKKVLGIVGSPRRKGNTHLMVSKILEGAEAEGAATDILLLGELNIQECNGCHTCWKGKPCSKKDDMQDIYSKIIESDVIVFGTPVYWFGPTALMKALIDRLVYFNCPENRARIRNKQAIVAIPFEDEDMETVSLLTAFFEKCLGYLEMTLVGSVVVPGVNRKGEILEKPDRLAEAYELGRESVKNL